MSLQGARVWLVTRGSGRAGYYQADLLDALQKAGAASVDVLDFGALFRSAAVELGSRATDWVETTAGRLLKSLSVRRLFGHQQEPAPPPEGESTQDQEGQEVPDLIVVDDPTLFLPLRMLPAYRQQTALTVALVDDFQADSRWRKSSPHAFILPHETFRALNVPADSLVPVRLAGPPLATGFVSSTSLAQARALLQIELGSPVVLVSAEGCDLGLLEKIIFQLTLVDGPPVVLFDYGSNEQVAQLLRSVAASYNLQARMFSSISDRGLTYAVADLVVTGADDPQILDILLSERPLLLVGPERGASRVPFLVDQGVVLWCEDVLELSTRLESSLPPRKPAFSVERVRQLIGVQGTAQVVEALVDLYSQREVILQQTRPPEPPRPESPAPADAKTPAVQPIQFETIGAPPSDASTPATYPPITAVEAKDQMAALILKEREAERSLSLAVRERDRWLDRLEMAREAQDVELVRAGEQRLTLAREQVDRLDAQLETIRRSKEKLKQRVSRPSGAPLPGTGGSGPAEPRESATTTSMEERFRKMEVERDLARLRQRLREEGNQ
ncbi:MAG: hypothetical protein JW797_12475 [Bradymonadales bacterium]|nr:hypothetical protein [Bradymonadales bacterium]